HRSAVCVRRRSQHILLDRLLDAERFDLLLEEVKIARIRASSQSSAGGFPPARSAAVLSFAQPRRPRLVHLLQQSGSRAQVVGCNQAGAVCHQRLRIMKSMERDALVGIMVLESAVIEIAVMVAGIPRQQFLQLSGGLRCVGSVDKALAERLIHGVSRYFWPSRKDTVLFIRCPWQTTTEE
ncbi:unnamed protein product, partial [Mycena citricolor]